MGVSPEKQLAGSSDTVLQGRGQTADEIRRRRPFPLSGPMQRGLLGSL